MCGIAGIFDRAGVPVDRSLLERMTSALRHRGPDGHGYFADGSVGVGHRRLSIIDVEGGSQPISNEDGSLHVVFNGEIYNYVELREQLIAFGHHFKTASDTEVIVHAYEQWGAQCVSRFNGMFAFAIVNARDNSMFVARDHLGIKPLYYVVIGSQLLFASEIKALIQHQECRREVDLESLTDLFTFRYVPSPKTLFKGILKLPPGHIMHVDSHGTRVERFWKWNPQLRTAWDEDELIEEYQSLLEDAVRLQLRSDVPLGLFLSSGIDSGVLLAIMRKYSSGKVQAFTMGFEGGEKTNEVADARSMAELFDADHHCAMVGPSDYLKYYERYLWDLEEPVGHEAASAFYFLSKDTSAHVKVALTGQGADEPWAGYNRYVGVKLSSVYSRLPKMVTQCVAGIVTRIPGRSEALKRGVVSLGERDMVARFANIYSFFTADMKDRLYGDAMKQVGAGGYDAKDVIRCLQGDVRDLDPVSQMLYIDTRGSLPDDLLMVGDKMSMANSLEVRVPFLDYRLIEFAESLPPTLKLNGMTGKYLHKKALEKWLPKRVIYRKKKGFANPLEHWFRNGMRSFVDECLLGSDSAVGRFFDQRYIRDMLQRDRHGTEPLARHIHLLVSFELWHRMFIKA
jgi:asparagine synthase (glutamine-hydrolysing)